MPASVSVVLLSMWQPRNRSVFVALALLVLCVVTVAPSGQQQQLVADSTAGFTPSAIVKFCASVMSTPKTVHSIVLQTRNCALTCADVKGLLGLTTAEVDFALACQVGYPGEREMRAAGVAFGCRSAQ